MVDSAAHPQIKQRARTHVVRSKLDLQVAKLGRRQDDGSLALDPVRAQHRGLLEVDSQVERDVRVPGQEAGEGGVGVSAPRQHDPLDTGPSQRVSIEAARLDEHARFPASQSIGPQADVGSRPVGIPGERFDRALIEALLQQVPRPGHHVRCGRFGIGLPPTHHECARARRRNRFEPIDQVRVQIRARPRAGLNSRLVGLEPKREVLGLKGGAVVPRQPGP